MLRYNLTEGMRAGDLEDLVQPLVSIDEYQSKIDEDAITLGFYVHDKDAADDLNRYIQKSAVSIIDCAVSPAPDQRGYYLVFVEICFNERIVSNIKEVLEEVSPLAGIEKWQMKVRNLEGMSSFDSDKLIQVLKVNHISDKIVSMKNEIVKVRKDIKLAAQKKIADEQKAAKAKRDKEVEDKQKAKKEKVAKQNAIASKDHKSDDHSQKGEHPSAKKKVDPNA